jgi:hypothetical protein
MNGSIDQPVHASAAPAIPLAWARWSAILLASLLFFALVAALYVGFQGSDDMQYLDGALGWLERFPYVGDNHWTLRHTVTLPTAAFIALFGMSEISASASNVVYFAAFLATNAYFMCRHVGGRAAMIATLLLMTMPGFIVVATYLNPDIPELFFVTAAFWLWYSAIRSPDDLWRWIACGIVAGLAFVNRQTSAALPIFLAVLFVANPMARRSRYFVLGAAFLGVIAIEWLYITVMTGDPVFRYRIDLHHDPVDRFVESARVAASGQWLDKEGMLSVNVFLDPVLNLFVTQKYVLLFWAAIPAALAVLRGKSERARLLSLIAGLAATSFLFIALNPKLYLVPRYFVIAAWGAAVIVGCWASDLWASRRRGWARLMVAGMLLANGLALSVEETNPRFVERTLVRWVRLHPDEAIYTDVETRERSKYFFEFAHVPNSAVSSERPPDGALFLHNASRLQQCAAIPRCRSRLADFTPSPQWRVQETIAVPGKPLAAFASLLPLSHILPGDIARRLGGSRGNVVVYRVHQP